MLFLGRKIHSSGIMKGRIMRSPGELLKLQPWLSKFANLTRVVDIVGETTVQTLPPRTDAHGVRAHSFTSIRMALEDMLLQTKGRGVTASIWQTGADDACAIIVRSCDAWMHFCMLDETEAKLVTISDTEKFIGHLRTIIGGETATTDERLGTISIFQADAGMANLQLA